MPRRRQRRCTSGLRHRGGCYVTLGERDGSRQGSGGRTRAGRPGALAANDRGDAAKGWRAPGRPPPDRWPLHRLAALDAADRGDTAGAMRCCGAVAGRDARMADSLLSCTAWLPSGARLRHAVRRSRGDPGNASPRLRIARARGWDCARWSRASGCSRVGSLPRRRTGSGGRLRPGRFGRGARRISRARRREARAGTWQRPWRATSRRWWVAHQEIHHQRAHEKINALGKADAPCRPANDQYEVYACSLFIVSIVLLQPATRARVVPAPDPVAELAKARALFRTGTSGRRSLRSAGSRTSWARASPRWPKCDTISPSVTSDGDRVQAAHEFREVADQYATSE